MTSPKRPSGSRRGPPGRSSRAGAARRARAAAGPRRPRRTSPRASPGRAEHPLRRRPRRRGSRDEPFDPPGLGEGHRVGRGQLRLGAHLVDQLARSARHASSVSGAGRAVIAGPLAVEQLQRAVGEPAEYQGLVRRVEAAAASARARRTSGRSRRRTPRGSRRRKVLVGERPEHGSAAGRGLRRAAASPLLARARARPRTRPPPPPARAPRASAASSARTADGQGARQLRSRSALGASTTAPRPRSRRSPPASGSGCSGSSGRGAPADRGPRRRTASAPRPALVARVAPRERERLLGAREADREQVALLVLGRRALRQPERSRGARRTAGGRRGRAAGTLLPGASRRTGA